MAEKTFAQALNEHVPSEFAASQAYLAAAIYYDDLTMPRMAAFFSGLLPRGTTILQGTLSC